MSLDILELDPLKLTDSRAKELVAYAVSRVDAAERDRDEKFRERWDEYYRLWRGIPDPRVTGTKRTTEESQAVMPALQQAVESVVAEEEEATFGRKQWLIFEDEDTTDLTPEEAQDRFQFLQIINKRFLDDAEEADVPSNVAEAFLNGGLYGTGIGKIVVTSEPEMVPADTTGGLVPQDVVRVGLEPVSPYEFVVIGPAGKDIDKAHGCAHVMMRPLHHLYEKQNQGIYKKVALEAWTDDRIPKGGDQTSDSAPGNDAISESAHVIEYHGLVPEHLVEGGKEDSTKLVEVILTIANKNVLLRSVLNPFLADDRSFVLFQQDTIPGEVWGRGVCEKGYWPQKVLDAEVDARIAALAFSSRPMVGVNASMLANRGQKLVVRPGRQIAFNGPPRDAIAPVQFPAPDPQTYRQSAEMERMIEAATGGIQAATSPSINSTNSTATGISLSQTATLKRQKRTLQNIDRNFLSKFVRKALLRYMEFAPERYPFFDYRFKVNATMGILAREVEQQQQTNLLNTVPGGSPAYWLVLSSIYQNSSVENRDQMVTISQQMFQQSVQPPEPEPDLAGQARILSIQQRQGEHQDTMEFKNRELDEKTDQSNRDRQVDIAKETAKD